MSEKEDVQCFDFDNDELNPGDTINVYDYLNNSWLVDLHSYTNFYFLLF